jgi:hypothetical protein
MFILIINVGGYDIIEMGKKSKEMVDIHFDWIEIAKETLKEYKAIL